MNTTLATILALMTFNLFWAFYTTISKEKIMIEQGEGALPSSTYSFIALRHLTRMGLIFLVFNLPILSSLLGMESTTLFFTWVGIGAIIELISAIVETIVRLIYFKITFSKKG